ncbi:hypothetical protein M514_00646 [Trichuris suis]|uniref:Uncharacterized protein n=1 Tax=Trichuris suis TaxID=68888 RepID=A0A085N723_9BILA|nr:hypothetical protein M513_00646 [Trichuris suis]KFD65269.1 hypothetical protein M514_00646 [Trichuris suis]
MRKEFIILLVLQSLALIRGRVVRPTNTITELPYLMIRLGQLTEYYQRDSREDNAEKVKKLEKIHPHCTEKCEKKKKMKNRFGGGWHKEMGQTCMVTCYIKKIEKREKKDHLNVQEIYTVV